MAEQPSPALPRVAVIPLTPRQASDDAQWLGLMLGKLLAEHLRGVGLPVIAPNLVSQHIQSGQHRLPLSAEAAEDVRAALKADALVHGGYVLDEEAKLLGFNLLVDAPDVPRIPLEVAAPLTGFGRFIERITLAVVEQIGVIVSEVVRTRIHNVPRPSSFDAYRQLARAYAAWSRDQNELALTALSSARTLDVDFEEIAALQVAIAREADDISTARDAFLRWVELAKKRGNRLAAGERLTQLGHWLVERGEWSEARKTYDEARKLFHDEQYERGIAQALNNEANLDLARGKAQAAIQTYRRNLRLFETDPEASPDIAITYFNLALAHKNLGQRDEAQKALDQALTLARSQRDTRLEGMCLAQQGALRDDAGQWGQARAAYEQAARLLDAAGDQRGRALVISHQAMLYKQQGAFDQAEKLINEALALFGENGDPHARAILSLNLADLNFSMGDYERAWELAEQAHETFAELESDWQIIARELMDTLESLPEPEPAASEDEPALSSPTEVAAESPSTFDPTDLPVTAIPRQTPRIEDRPITPPSPFGGDLPPFMAGESADEDDKSEP